MLIKPCRVYPTKVSNGYVGTRFGLAHKLVAQVCHNECQPFDKNVRVRHLCLDQKACCEPEHLRPDTPRQNSLDVVKAGGGTRKLTDDNVREIYALKGVASGNSVAQRFDMSAPAILNIWNHKTWTHVTQPEQ